MQDWRTRGAQRDSRSPRTMRRVFLSLTREKFRPDRHPLLATNAEGTQETTCGKNSVLRAHAFLNNLAFSCKFVIAFLLPPISWQILNFGIRTCRRFTACSCFASTGNFRGQCSARARRFSRPCARAEVRTACKSHTEISRRVNSEVTGVPNSDAGP